MRDDKTRKLDPKNEAHAAFAERVADLKNEDLVDLFALPRNKRGQDLFNEMNALSMTLFSDLKSPLSDEDLKKLLIAAIELNGSTYILDRDNLEVNPRVMKNGRLEPGLLTVHLENPLYQPKRKKEAATEINAEVVTAEIKPNPKHAVATPGESIFPIIDKVEKPILDSLKNQGYTKVVKSDAARRFTKEDGNYFDLHKDGSMKSKPQEFTGDPDEMAKQCAKNFIAMISVYHETAKQYGKDLAFPSGKLDLSMTISKEDEINKLTAMYVRNELSKPPLDSIRDKFSYDGKPIEPLEKTATMAYDEENKTRKKEYAKNAPAAHVEQIPRGGNPTGKKSDRDELRKNVVMKQAQQRGRPGGHI